MLGKNVDKKDIPDLYTACPPRQLPACTELKSKSIMIFSSLQSVCRVCCSCAQNDNRIELYIYTKNNLKIKNQLE